MVNGITHKFWRDSGDFVDAKAKYEPKYQILDIPGDTQDIGQSDGAQDEPAKSESTQHAPWGATYEQAQTS